ncbi:hypothetical protein NP569_25915, partial [Vibrio parahaemolyticus]|nr:hypothetical protein [Vibrio parahaemolyticus]
EAIAAGIFNDLVSGSTIDLCVISKSKLDFRRPFSVPNKKGTKKVQLALADNSQINVSSRPHVIKDASCNSLTH